MKAAILAVFLSMPTALSAQEPVVKWADWTSWGTVLVNPIWGTVSAFKTERPGCHLGQLALSSGIGLGTALVLQHVIDSPRPCCPGNGMPSAHATAGMIGLAQPWPAHSYALRLSIGFGSAGATAGLRQVAHRHTPPQVVAGLFLGAGAELLSQLVPCE
jgi:hypothetical protein